RAFAACAVSFSSVACACCSAASNGRLSSVTRTWPFSTSSPSLKFTDVISPVIWAWTETVDAAITVPIPWIVIGIDLWTAFATVTGTCAFWPPPPPRPDGGVAWIASPPERDPLCEHEAERDANPSAEQAEDDRFEEDLQQHIAPARADGHAQADLARPLGDRHQHDIHDPDAAHQQRHAGDAGEQRHHGLRRFFPDARHFLHRADHEVVRVARLNLVTPAEQRGDGVGRSGRFRRRGGRHGDLLDERDAAQLFHHGRIRHEDRVVLILAHARLALAPHPAH